METSIKSLMFSTPFTNAAGVWCTTEKELKEIRDSAAGFVTFKSMTIFPRKGNVEPRFSYFNHSSINSMGLPNKGVDYYCKVAKKLQGKKPMIASIAGFSPDEYITLLKKVNNAPFDGIEVNLSCPNVVGKGIFAYNIPLSIKIMKELRKMTEKVLGVKLPPYVSRDNVKNMAEGLINAKVDFVTTINSFPLGCAIDYKKEKMKIKPNDGIGGLGGAATKNIGIGQVVLFRQFSKGKLGIIGVGGVEKGSDVYEYILAGASAVAVGTALWKNKPVLFSKLKYELESIMKKQKVKKLSEKIGALKII